MSTTRRDFLKYTTLGAICLKCTAFGISILSGSKSWAAPRPDISSLSEGRFLGVDSDGYSRVYLARDAIPERNIARVLELMGGIGRFIDPSDIVVIKPNAQWWHQGMTNTDAMKGFIDLIFGIPGFSGEVIIAENHQFTVDDSRGWTTDKPNGKFNLNQLVDYFKQQGHKNISKCHWRVAGPCSAPLQGNAQGNRRILSPSDGDGYVWMTEEYYISPEGRKCLMTYPVFTSPYSGITIDLKNGAWKDGRYLDRKTKLINFSALNHHGAYAGVTATVKNLMGVVDMTCGWPADGMPDTFNVHHIGISKFIRYAKKIPQLGAIRLRSIIEEYCHRNFHYTGGALGNFMRIVRMPNLNIITAINVGWGARIDPAKAFRADTILASTDPVALDYIAAKEVLLPGTPAGKINADGLPYRKLNDPDQLDGPFRNFLRETHKQGIGNLDHNRIKVIAYKAESIR